MSLRLTPSSTRWVAYECRSVLTDARLLTPLFLRSMPEGVLDVTFGDRLGGDGKVGMSSAAGCREEPIGVAVRLVPVTEFDKGTHGQ